jgi:lysophospholipase L1-like esterase
VKRLAALIAAGLVLLAAPVSARSATTTTTYRVVGTGDSILALSRPQLTSADRWLDLEQGRQVDIVGNQGRATTADMLPRLLARSRPGGWVIVQDNAAQTTLARWREVLREYVTTIPDDRCLLGVLPVFDAAVDPVAAANAQAAANVMVAELSVQPCRAFIRWNQAVQANPALTYDGQHPSAEGVAWLARAIDDVIGFRS